MDGLSLKSVAIDQTTRKGLIIGIILNDFALNYTNEDFISHSPLSTPTVSFHRLNPPLRPLPPQALPETGTSEIEASLTRLVVQGQMSIATAIATYTMRTIRAAQPSGAGGRPCRGELARHAKWVYILTHSISHKKDA